MAIKSPCAGPPSSENNVKVLSTFISFDGTLIIEQKFLKEVHAWSKLDHANVLPLLGVTTLFDLTVSTISPWMENGNARNYVQDKAVDPRPLVSAYIRRLIL